MHHNRTALSGWNVVALFLVGLVPTQCGPAQNTSAPQVVLQVLSDNGAGLVVSQPDGINCGTGCVHTFDQGTVVQLTATQLPRTYGAFASWGGACSGTQSTCSVTLQESQTVIANWAAMPGDNPPAELSLSLIAGALGATGAADDTGRLARFNQPYGVAADGAGNLYVVDSGTANIRKIVLATGVVSTIAGTAGVFGQADGTGAAAQFSTPYGVAADGAGNLYVSDSGNAIIRKIVLATGAVSTLAGTAGGFGSADGIGAAAQFNGLDGLAADGAGNLYVADSGNYTIRKIVLATGVVSTLAGSAGMTGSADGTGTAARWNGPQAVAADRAGNLYVTDLSNITKTSTIRKVVLATGVVSTLAGSASMFGSVDGIGTGALFTNPYGLTVDGEGNLYVSDTGNNTIRKLVLATGAVTTLAGSVRNPGITDGTGSAARFSQPYGVAADGTGNLYIADIVSSTIRKLVVATGAVSTFAGTAIMDGSTDGTGAAARFGSPYAVAADGAGNLYVADVGNATLRKVVLATGVVSTIAGTAGMTGSADGTGAAAQFAYPCAVAADGAGNLYVADSDNATIRKMVLATGVVSTIAGTAGMNGSEDGTGPAAYFSGPCGVAADGAGNLYVADSGNATLRKVVLASGAVTTLAGTAGMTGSEDGTGPAASFNFPNGVAADGAGNLYVADSGNATLRKVVLATGVVTTLAGTAGMLGSTNGTGAAARFSYPTGVAIDGAGHLYVADNANSTLRKVVLASGSVTTLIGVAGQRGVKLGLAPARLNQPNAVTVLPSGEIIIVDAAENAILMAR